MNAASAEELRAENDRLWERFKLVLDRYMTCLHILGERYQHPYVAAYWNELLDLVRGNLDADSECTAYWNKMCAMIDAAYEKTHGRGQIPVPTMPESDAELISGKREGGA